METLGYRVYIPDGLFARKGYLAGNDSHRAEMFNQIFNDDNIRGVLCARGGFGSIRVLEFLDYRRISFNPKIFIGYSDISALLSAIYIRCNMVVFHGPTVTDLAKADVQTIDSFLEAISMGKNYNICLNGMKVMKHGLASGKISGGNLTTLCHLAGTSYQPSFKNHLLFLEDRGEAPYRIDRMLTQMRMAGYFNGISALILGSFENCGKEQAVLEIFEEKFVKNDMPIISCFQAGHGTTNLTLPFGVNAILDTSKRQLSFNEPATVPMV